MKNENLRSPADELREFMQSLRSKIKTCHQAEEVLYDLIDYKDEFQDLRNGITNDGIREIFHKQDRFDKELESLKTVNSDEFHIVYQKILHEFPEYATDLDIFCKSIFNNDY